MDTLYRLRIYDQRGLCCDARYSDTALMDQRIRTVAARGTCRVVFDNLTHGGRTSLVFEDGRARLDMRHKARWPAR